MTFISEEQFGFLFNRKILDAVSSVQEDLHTIRIKKLPATVMKLDLAKAYNKVNWTFLRLVLLQISLRLEAVNWISGCVSLASFVVLINGTPSRFFKASRGLRQGCPLSPFLFLIIAESLSRLINSAKLEGSVKGIMVAKATNLTHMLFVDNVLLFGDSTVREWRSYKHTF